MSELRYQRETIDQVWGDIAPLLVLHHYEASAFKEFPLCPNLALYRRAEATDSLRIFTARDGEGQLVGYLVLLVGQDAHHSQIKYAHTNVFFVLPECRGGTGKALLATAEEALILEGVQVVYQSEPLVNPTRFYARRGYQLVERIWAKKLGEAR